MEKIYLTSLLAALMEDDGTISERGPLGRGSVDRFLGLKYLRSTIIETHVIVQSSVFRGYLFLRTSKNPRKPRNFCPSKISSYTVTTVENVAIAYVRCQY